jgi:bifunctional polynucleotide phosphatase/kinase
MVTGKPAKHLPFFLKGIDEDIRFLVVVISNQGGISLKIDPKTVKSDQRRLSQFKAKVHSVFAQLDFPISIYAATARDQYRKPRTGMWKELLEEFDLDVEEGLDLQESIFVGDAGGRPARGGIKADHSSSDR